MTISELIPVLQMAIGPVVLISGVGLLILSLTNRLGRIVDRGRSLAGEFRRTAEPGHPKTLEQLQSLTRRAWLLQRAIIFAVLCVLLSVVLIVALFLIAAFKIEATWLVGGLFIAALGCLILSLVAFLQELNQALIAFRMDIER